MFALINISKFCGFGACKSHFKKKRRDPESSEKDPKLVMICQKCELCYLNKILQERFLEKKQKKDQIIINLEEKLIQTSENLKKKRQILDMLEVQKKNEENIFIEKMVQISDQINSKKQETMSLERENKEISKKYEEITKKIKEKELEIAALQNEISLASKKNEEMSKNIEQLNKDREVLKQDIDQKETSVFLNSNNFIHEQINLSQKHYQNKSETNKNKSQDNEFVLNEKIEVKDNACMTFCKCVLY